jgi:hypothetical protein
LQVAVVVEQELVELLRAVVVELVALELVA